MNTKQATGITQRLAGFACVLLSLVVLLAACEDEPDDQPPADWETDGDRWWHTEVDTSEVYRDVETLEVMLVDYEEPPAHTEGSPLTPDQFAHGLRTELKPMYRHNPDVVDSLFAEHVMQDLEDEDEFAEHEIDEQRVDAYEELREHFREPEVRTELGSDVHISYPDTLEGNPEGRVAMQVYLDEEGVPRALRLNESLEPTLDRIAMRAATQMRWEPAYINRDGEWEPIPSWTEFNVNFQAPN